MSVKSYYKQFSEENGAHSYTTFITRNGKKKKVLDYKVSKSAETTSECITSWRV